MYTKELDRLFLGHRTFLSAGTEDFGLVIGVQDRRLPLPLRIFLDDEEATPVRGFPVLHNAKTVLLRSGFERFVATMIDYEAARAQGAPLGSGSATAGWSEYRDELRLALSNAVRSSFGRGYPSIFWLYHSIVVSRGMKEIPRRLLQSHPAIGKTQGPAIKYRVFQRYLDLVLNETYDIVNQVAVDLEEPEEELFPNVLERMRDNVLILTEDHISPDLRELDTYFSGYLNADGLDFRKRFSRLTEWHLRALEKDPDLRGMVRSFLGIDEFANPWTLLIRPGYVKFLSTRPRYTADKLLRPRDLELWDHLLERLKEFEILAGLRRYVVPVSTRGHELTAPAATLRSRTAGSREVTLSGTTRPMDFASSWVVDPLVHRFGLIYDITDFSFVVSVLRRSGSADQDASFRRIYSFQRQIDKLASSRRLKLEKYLGDGAFYSGRHPTLLVGAALRLQRFYKEVLDEDFPFDRGLRIALNHGPYRLLPIQGAGRRRQYEFFGHGIVELSRLVSGKTTHEIDEMKALLVQNGYPAREVDRFFAPVMRKTGATLTPSAQRSDFRAFINASGELINEGIVMTEAFVTEIAAKAESGLLGILGVARSVEAEYLVCEVEDPQGALRFGLRRLGKARLKGLGDVVVFEVRDATDFAGTDLQAPPEAGLLDTLARLYADAARGAASSNQPGPGSGPESEEISVR